MDIAQLALAFGSSLTAGLNLYITVLSLGLMNRIGWLELPSSLEILSNPWVMGTAGVLFLIEFVADKIPYVDNTWDTLQTFIRVPAGAVLAASAIGEIRPELFWVAALLGGVVTLTAHGAKASTRLALNSTPEPFTNWFMSFVEDGVVLLLMWLVSDHPYVALALGSLLLIGFSGMIFLLFKFFRRILGRRSPQPVAG